MTYLGIPVHNVKLRNSDWIVVENKTGGKLETWQGRLMSYGDN